MKTEEIRHTVDRMIQEGRLDDAIRLSSEELALADSRLHQIYSISNDDERCRAMSDLLAVGVIHADCLFRGGYYVDAVPLCVTLLLMASADFSLDNREIGPLVMALCYLALVSFEACGTRLGDIAEQVPDGEEHVRRTISCLASVMYRLYTEFKDEPGPWPMRVYELLDGIRGAGRISTPFLVSFVRKIDPVKPADVIGDIIGRLRALGFRFGV